MSGILIPPDRLLQRLANFSDRSPRQAEVRRWFRYSPVEDLVPHLDQMLVACVRAEPMSRLFHITLADVWLHTDPHDEMVLEILAIAVTNQKTDVLHWLLLDPPSARNAQLHRVQLMSHNQAAPLGTRRWKARLRDKGALEALMVDPDPIVVQHLCQNPTIIEHDVVSMAARRPNKAEVLETIAGSRWLFSEPVRTALIQNPYTRTGLSLTLLPQMGRPLMRKLHYATDLHPKLVEAATCFLKL